MRVASGDAARNSSSIFGMSSRDWLDRPVTLAPGCARLRTKPLSHRIGHARHHDRNLLRDLHRGARRTCTPCDDDIGPQPDELACDRQHLIAAQLNIAAIHREILAFDVTQFAQSVNEGLTRSNVVRFESGKQNRNTEILVGGGGDSRDCP